MKYDLETVVDRSGTGSVKWNLMHQADPGVPAGTIPLSIGDMELKSPPELVAGLKEYLDNFVLGYTAATDAFREAVADWFRRRHGWNIKKSWLMGIDGVVPALYLSVSTFTSPGDGVIYMPPVYRPLYHAVNNGNRRPVAVPLLEKESGWEMDFDGLETAAARPDVKMLLFCSPHNPVSRVWRREELERLGDICRRNDLLVVSDEIHMDFIMPGHRHHVFSEIAPDLAERSIICTAPSKTFNIAGLQTSNLVIPNRDLRRRLHKAYQDTGRHEPNQLGLEACRLAYTRCEGWLDAVLGLIHANGEMVRRFMHEHFPGVRVYDLEGTYFLWLDFRSWGLSPEALENHMVKKARLFLDEGYIFGPEGEGFERVNLACPSWALRQALERLLEAGRE